MLSKTEIQERIEDAKFWQAKEQDGSVLDGILKAKIDELEQVLGSNEDTRTGYFIIDDGTNRRMHVMKDQPAICDTEEHAQKLISKRVTQQEQMGVKTAYKWIPISIQEYNQKYVI